MELMEAPKVGDLCRLEYLALSAACGDFLASKAHWRFAFFIWEDRRLWIFVRISTVGRSVRMACIVLAFRIDIQLTLEKSGRPKMGLLGYMM